MKQAVCVLIEHPVNGRVLCVSRRDNLLDWGLPGGKVEDGEELVSAARRELKEETGLDLASLDILYPYHERVCRGEDNYNCTVFRLVSPSEMVLGFQYQDSREGKVEWRQWGDLVSDTASFKDYNQELLLKLNKEAYVANATTA